MVCDCDTASIPYTLVAARAVHFASCLLIFGVFAFDRFAAGPISTPDARQRGSAWRFWNAAAKALAIFGLIAALISGAAWFYFVARDNYYDPAGPESLYSTVRIVWQQTQFGHVWQLHAGFLLGSAIATAIVLLTGRPSLFRAAWMWLGLLCSGGLAVTLVWAGHGQEGTTDASARWHMAADGAHLLICGFWPVGLLPMALLLLKLRRSIQPDRWLVLASLTRRFSAISLLGVALLTATGLVNTWFLVGSWPALYQSWYGRVLLIKVGLFALMVVIGAVNLLFLKPALGRRALRSDAGSPALALQCSVIAELLLATLVVVAVGFLGVLPPAMP